MGKSSPELRRHKRHRRAFELCSAAEAPKQAEASQLWPDLSSGKRRVESLLESALSVLLILHTLCEKEISRRIFCACYKGLPSQVRSESTT